MFDLHVDEEREGEVLVLPEHGGQAQLHSRHGARAGGQREGELCEAGHGGDGQLVVDVTVGVQRDQAPALRQGEDVGAGNPGTQTLLGRGESETTVVLGVTYLDVSREVGGD